jgi:PTH2 family peptidyl-tRNA hydrolase
MEIKQVIVVRKDLGMGTGKISAQVAHAAVTGAIRVSHSNPDWFNDWFSGGQAKVVLKVQSMMELAKVKKDATELGLPVSQIDDKGLTQIPAGTTTCIAIGPAPENLIDRVTSELKLL